MSRCTATSHDGLRATWRAFLLGTDAGLGWAWEGHWYANTRCCSSTIGFPVCDDCGAGCDADDRLMLRDPKTAAPLYRHFRCEARRALARERVSFVIVAGPSGAVEFSREAAL